MEEPPLGLEASLPSNTLPFSLQTVLKEEDSSDFQWPGLEEKFSAGNNPRVLLFTVEYIADVGENRAVSTSNAGNNTSTSSTISRYPPLYNTLVLPSSAQTTDGQYTNAFVVLPQTRNNSQVNLLLDPSDSSHLLVSNNDSSLDDDAALIIAESDEFKPVAELIDGHDELTSSSSSPGLEQRFVISNSDVRSTHANLGIESTDVCVSEDELLSQDRALFYQANNIEEHKILSGSSTPDNFVSSTTTNSFPVNSPRTNSLLHSSDDGKVLLDTSRYIIDNNDLKDEQLLLSDAEQNADLLIKADDLMEVDTFNLNEEEESQYINETNIDGQSFNLTSEHQLLSKNDNSYLLPFDVDNSSMLQTNLEVLCSSTDNDLLLYDKGRLRKRKKHPAEHLGFDYWCEDCEDPFGRKCPAHDVKTILDKPVLPRARATLPKEHLAINKIPGLQDVEGVFARKTIPKKVQFGPIEGAMMHSNSVMKNTSGDEDVQLLLEVETGELLVIDVTDENESNWMRFVRRAKSVKEQNLMLTQQGKSLYFTTTRVIPPRQELKVGYSMPYAKKRGLPYSEDLTWSCFDCPQRFATSNDLRRHLYTHDVDYEGSNKNVKKRVKGNKEAAEKIHKCSTCNRIFPRMYSLKRHLLFVHPNKTNKETTNNTVTTTTTLFKKKQVNGVSGSAWLCTHCNLTFDNPSLLNLHTLTHAAEDLESETVSGLPSELTSVYHEGEFLVENGDVQCPQCTRQFPSKRELIDHVTSHGKVTKAVPTASDAPRPQATLQQKQRPVPTPPAKSYKCEHCYKAFATDLRLQRHQLVHGSDESKPYQCTTCFKRFLNNSALACHVKTHFDRKYFECPLCKDEFENVFGLREHVKTHAHDGLFTCPHCGKVFDGYSVVRKHIRAFHSEHQHACKECGKTCPTMDKLRMHSLRHSDHREFLCDDCGKQFKRKDKLKEHMKRMHSVERELKLLSSTLKANSFKDKKFVPKMSPVVYERYIYKCRPCMVGFKRRGMLVNHLANRHPDIVPETVPELNLPILKTTRDYFCQYCDKIYKSSSKRKAHILKNHPGAELPMSNRQKGGIPNIPGVPNPTFSQTVGSVKTTPQNCHWCYKQYASKAKLLQHQRKKHLTLLPRAQQVPRPVNLETGARTPADTTQIADVDKITDAPARADAVDICPVNTNEVLIDANILKKSLKELPENILLDHTVADYHKAMKVVASLKENVNVNRDLVTCTNNINTTTTPGNGGSWPDVKMFPRHPPR